MKPILIVIGLFVSFATVRAAAPPLFEPDDHFYKARGVGVKVSWTVDRKEIPADGELTATLTVKNAHNPQQVVRPGLRKLPEFQNRFQIVDVPAPAKADAREVVFVYRLRPRSAEVAEVPALQFKYLTPMDRLNTTVAKAVPIKVTAAAVKPAWPAAAVPLEGPEELFHVVTGPEVWRRKVWSQTWFGLIWLGSFGAIAGLTWYVFWLRFYPDAATQAKLRRSRAARQALRAIGKAERADDAAEALAAAVRDYLNDRFPLPPHAVTPSEIEEALGTEHSGPIVEPTVVFFQHCDAARFSPADDSQKMLGGAEARDLIAAWEAS